MDLDFIWNELAYPPEGILEYHISISRQNNELVEDYQLHVFRFDDDVYQQWRLALHIPVNAEHGQIIEYGREFWGSLEDAKTYVENSYTAIYNI